MTRENHINNLQSMIDDAEDMGLYDEDVESLEEAIKALKQEAYEDTISIQAVVNWLKDKDFIKLSSQENVAIKELKEYEKTLAKSSNN